MSEQVLVASSHNQLLVYFSSTCDGTCKWTEEVVPTVVHAIDIS